jgi:hypothetical protein
MAFVYKDPGVIACTKKGELKRVPGVAIPKGQRRDGALGGLDSRSLTKFRELPKWERQQLLDDARSQKRRIELEYAAKLEVLRYMGEAIERRTDSIGPFPYFLDGRDDICILGHITPSSISLASGIFKAWEFNIFIGQMRNGKFLFEHLRKLKMPIPLCITKVVEKPDSFDILIGTWTGTGSVDEFNVSKKKLGLAE